MKIRTAQDIQLGPIKVARNFWARARGLLGRAALAPGTGLWLEPGGSIHTLGMRFAIDVVFLNGRHQVLALRENLKPWRLCTAPTGTRSVLELGPGEIARYALVAGQTLVVEEDSAEDTHHA